MPDPYRFDREMVSVAHTSFAAFARRRTDLAVAPDATVPDAVTLVAPAGTVTVEGRRTSPLLE